MNKELEERLAFMAALDMELSGKLWSKFDDLKETAAHFMK